MVQELVAAGDQLCSSLDRYVRACSSTRAACLSGGRLDDSPELRKSLEKQSNDIMSHITKLEDARAAVQAVRSNIPKLTPINDLPVEILARIFHLFLPDQSCLVQRGYTGKITKIKYPLYPDTLAQVCSYWRQIAVASPELWTHIDIVLDHPLNPGLFARAKVYATRAGRLPLEIHISDPGSEREKTQFQATQDGGTTTRGNRSKLSHEWEDLHDFKIFTSDIVPIKTLELDLCIYDRIREIYYSLLEYFFAHCEGGVLTKYIVRRNPGWVISCPFIEPAETPHSRDGALLAVPIRHLDDVWFRISSIRANALYPHWKSKIYHGLVELYIDKEIPEISESQLVNILRSSPNLQVFHFDALLEAITDHEIIDPVYLEDLRELKLVLRCDSEATSASRILQYIAPGSKPLQLSVANAEEWDIANFFSRANVTRFYGWGVSDMIPILSQCRLLEVLVLNEQDLGTQNLNSVIDRSFDSDDSDGGVAITYTSRPSSSTRINTLYLLWYSHFVFEQLQAVVEKHSVQRLIIYYGRLSYQTDEGRVLCNNTRNIRAKLSTITSCPHIEYHPNGYPDSYLDGNPNDTDAWIRDASRS
ncbi:unnamed protein product [Rhizoctonia solani]|uniref:F-box domain-containing protein n=1 Tax=Rhizoctonia solani TaxID=456999 RepID=A0A8H3GLW3_9AGAM|nr:unnamed protein product [Rhizoctonia solani]